MKFSQIVPLSVLILASTGLLAQPDYLRYGMASQPAPADPAIVHALESIHASSIEQTIKTLVSFGTRSTLSSEEHDLPPKEGIRAASDWIYGQFEEISHKCGGCLEVHRDTFIADPSASGARWGRRIPHPTELTNVYAILRGTDPVQAKRMYLVTGHYDSRNTNVLDARGKAPGANDDASGVAVSIECARALSRLRFPATLVFVAVAGEEQGLVGSAHLAKLAHDEGWQLEAVLNNDIVGGNTTPGDNLQLKDRVRIFSEGVPASATEAEVRRILALGKENDSPSREVARAVAAAARTYLHEGMPMGFSAFLVARPDRYLRGGDHSSFNHEGFAAVRLTEWREDYNHQHHNVVIPPAGSNDPILGDLPRFVDYHYVEHVAKLNAATLATLASAPQAPQKLAIETHNLENDTTLTWQPSAGATHYIVLWRATDAPDWQYEHRVEKQNATGDITATLPISKDNVIFGVCAVDAKGHRSLVSVP
ncbi:MAG TPA: M20/M25/M40 family metallo-hydrolase [Terracidiphilus sp.]|nr:M20/M25/M40 family metallo-hydrolase [Terracidiphilus sp.]